MSTLLLADVWASSLSVVQLQPMRATSQGVAAADRRGKESYRFPQASSQSTGRFIFLSSAV